MAGKAKGRRGGGRGTIVVRRIEESGHGRHGGAWKVAYADFVTAMMAFFLLMWLLNATTEEQRRGLADYFAPPNLLGRTVSGSGRPFGGQTPHDTGNMTSTTGAIRIEPGPLPVVMDVEEDHSDTPARPAPPRDGPPGAEEVDPRTVERTRPGPAPAEGQAVAGAAPRGVPPGEGEGAPAGPSAAGVGAGAAARDDGLRPRPHDATAAPPPPQDATDAAPPRETAGATPPMSSGHADTSAAEAAAAERLAEQTLRAELARREAAAFERAAEQLRAAVHDDPALADLARQLLIEQTPEGMRVQILDAERQPMFALGGSAPNERARALLARVAQAVAQLPNAISLAGHTDATPFREAPRAAATGTFRPSTPTPRAACSSRPASRRRASAASPAMPSASR
jgi:chemotaxis protein MotB